MSDSKRERAIKWLNTKHRSAASNIAIMSPDLLDSVIDAMCEFSEQEGANEVKDICKGCHIQNVSGSLICNGFKIEQQENLPPDFAQWKGIHIVSKEEIFGRTKRECLRTAENYR